MSDSRDPRKDSRKITRKHFAIVARRARKAKPWRNWA